MFFILVGCSGVPCSLSWLVAWPETGLRTPRRGLVVVGGPIFILNSNG